MVNVLSKISIPVATKEVNHFNLSCRNTTTMDFFKIKPVYTRELMPKSKFKMNLGLFSRLAPMVKPAYVDVNFVSRAFFVPFRTIMEGWNEFITDTQYKQQIPRVPIVYARDLCDAFIVWGYESDADFDSETALTYPGTASSYDIVLPDAAVAEYTQQYYKFTRLGRHVYDVICNLGYGFRVSAVTIGADDTTFSLLPLLGYYKLFQDWYRNPSYNYAWHVTFPVAYNYTLGAEDLRNILYDFRYGFYERNYFTAAWDNPVAPNNYSSTNMISIDDQSLPSRAANGKSQVKQDPTDGTPVIKLGSDSLDSANNAPKSITKFILQSVNLLTDYCRRHQVAGTQAMERFLARFGVQLTDAKLSRSVYLDKMVANVRIGDLMNTTAPQDSNAAALGEYAGHGEGKGGGSFHCETDEFGQFYVVSVCIPQVQYVQGVDRSLQHISRTSFFTPEFDSLGMQAIRCDEVVGRDLGAKTVSGVFASSDVFGFSNRYGEYKVAVDRCTGDFGFDLDNPTNDMNVYHLARLFDPMEKPQHDLSFTRAEPQQYNRIFADTSTVRDHFINIFYFDIDVQQPCCRLFDDYEFEDEDSGHRISLPLNGVQKD